MLSMVHGTEYTSFAPMQGRPVNALEFVFQVIGL